MGKSIQVYLYLQYPNSRQVTGVAFDPWRCDENVYRFASVGEDAKLILWDFSVNALHRPKAVRTVESGMHLCLSKETNILPM